MDAALRARLVEIAGEKFVDGDSVSPSTAEQVEKVCLACAEAGVRIAVSSAPAKGAAAPAGAVLVSLSGIDPVDVDHDRLVARAGAGATLGAVRQAAEKVGLTITGAQRAGAADARVGEVIATGQVARRALTGIEAVLPGGGRVSAGGAVLKDVAGYDLIGALLGSRGRLALITAATFRLQPSGVSQETGEPAGVPRAVLGEALEAAFDPQRLLAGRS
ncbi:MAG TPA: FAD-binding protein [Candidatus Angelobacter sp.]|jgi:FAD/FMN-containing dehydrogenase|nr:FAD-binding protein [Candidatus Angelobacter sp.]